MQKAVHPRSYGCGDCGGNELLVDTETVEMPGFDVRSLEYMYSESWRP